MKKIIVIATVLILIVAVAAASSDSPKKVSKKELLEFATLQLLDSLNGNAYVYLADPVRNDSGFYIICRIPTKVFIVERKWEEVEKDYRLTAAKFIPLPQDLIID